MLKLDLTEMVKTSNFMKMKNKLAPLIIIFLFLQGCKSPDIFIPKLTNINPTSYTDVIFIGRKDTVLVSTYSGRIAKRIKDKPKEIVVAQIDDEIYSLAYNPEKKEIIAATLENGLVVINIKNGKVIKKIALKTTWSIGVFFSENYDYLITNDLRGNRYIWDVNRDYKEISFSEKIPKGAIREIDKNNTARIITKNKIFFWDLTNDSLLKEVPITIDRLSDYDSEGNYLSLDFNKCNKFNSTLNKVDFTLMHPSWIRTDPNDSNKSFEDTNFQMQLTSAKFAKNKIFTASIDRSLRVWDKHTGELLNSLTTHKATINKIKVSSDESQVVSIDLKGGINFWDVN